ncbi:MAG: hypothetical protein H9W81_09820 [Enterococcus sp.]|nr:hypothetical protein [Enterococcus sp.]
MPDSTIIRAKNKVAAFSYIPDWGAPGQWMVHLGAESSILLDDVSGLRSQHEQIERYVADRYILQVADENWSKMGDKDDAIRLCLEYTGYGEEERARDMKVIDALKRVVDQNRKDIFEIIGSVTIDEVSSLQSVDAISNEYRDDMMREIAKREEIVNAYDRLDRGEQVGIGWTNETFLRDFPDTRAAELIRNRLKTETTGENIV